MEVFRLELGNVVSLLDVVEGEEIVENQLEESSEMVLI